VDQGAEGQTGRPGAGEVFDRHSFITRRVLLTPPQQIRHTARRVWEEEEEEEDI